MNIFERIKSFFKKNNNLALPEAKNIDEKTNEESVTFLNKLKSQVILDDDVKKENNELEEKRKVSMKKIADMLDISRKSKSEVEISEFTESLSNIEQGIVNWTLKNIMNISDSTWDYFYSNDKFENFVESVKEDFYSKLPDVLRDSKMALDMYFYEKNISELSTEIMENINNKKECLE